MNTKKLLFALFDYQRFSQNKSLEKVINNVHQSYSTEKKESNTLTADEKLSEDDLQMFSAAGVETQLKLKDKD